MDQDVTGAGGPAVDPEQAPPAPSPPAPSPPEPSPPEPTPSASYLARHWRGELPLGISYWVNTVLLNVLLAGVVLALSTVLLRFDYGGVLALAMTWVAQCVLSVWQTVGIWRSAGRARPDGTRSRWAGLARFASVTGMVGLAITLVTDAVPTLWATLEQARWLAEQGNWAFRILRDGTEMEVAGGIGHGFAADLEAQLAANPGVTLVHVNLARGGLVSEARKAARALRDRHLATYVSAACVSACTDVYLGGKPRWFRNGARLGFHAPSAPGVRGVIQKRAVEEERQLLVGAGVSAEFATRASTTPHASMWYPTQAELVAGGVVTRVTDGDAFAYTTGSLPPSIEKARSLLASERLYEALRKADPAAHEELVRAVHAKLVEGRSLADARSATSPIVVAAYGRQIANASDEAILAVGRARVLQLSDLQSASGPACLALVLRKDGELAAEGARHLGPETRRVTVESMADVLESATPGRPAVDPAGKERLLVRAIRVARQEAGGDVAEAVLRGDGSLEPGDACRGVLLAHRAILRMPVGDAAALLRALLAPPE